MPWWDSTVNQPKTKSRFIVFFGDFFLPNIKSVTKPTVQFETKSYKLMNHHYNYPGTVKWDPIQIKMVCMNPFDVRDSDGDIRKKGLDTADMLWEMIKNTGYYYPDTKEHSLSRTGRERTTISTPEKASSIANGFGAGLYGGTGYQPGGAPSNTFQRVKIIQMSTGTNLFDIEGAVPFKPNRKTPINPVEQWELINPLIKSINFGDLSYDDDGFVEYTIDIVYDYAKYNKDDLEGAIPVAFYEEWQSFSSGQAQALQEQAQALAGTAAVAEDIESAPTTQRRAAQSEVDALTDDIFGDTSDILGSGPPTDLNIQYP
tara:strand:- start:864 stop:1811 length:948 start_codon:yes stop_codon:yes gene_type:complete